MIEEHYGKELFDRIGNQVKLTQFGLELSRKAGPLLNEYDLFGRQEGEIVKNSIIVIDSLSLHKSTLTPMDKEKAFNNKFDCLIDDFT